MNWNWIPIVGPAVQSIIDAPTSKKNTERTIKANKELAEYSYSKDIEMMNSQNAYNRDMWDLNNQYNSPQSQMSRLKDAGLNPNLVYGNGATATSSGPPARSETAKYNAPTVSYNYKPMVDIPGMLSMYQDFQMRQAQVDNLKANTHNTEARTMNESLRGGLLDVQTKSGELDYARKDLASSYDATVNYANAQKSENDVRMQLQSLRNMSQDEQLKYLERQSRERNLTTQDLENERKLLDNIFNRYRNEWMKQGITTSDSPYLRIIMRMLNTAGIDPAAFLGSHTK